MTKTALFKHIGLDLDGVIIDHTQNKIRLARESGFSLEPLQTPGHRMRKIFNNEEIYQKVRKPLYGVLTESASAVEGAIDGVKELKELGFNLYIISARHKENQPFAYRWINRHLAGIFLPDNIFFVEEEIKKEPTCQKLKIDIYLDDKVSVLEMLTVPARYLLDPYGIKNDYVLRNIYPVSSWQDFLDELNKKRG